MYSPQIEGPRTGLLKQYGFCEAKVDLSEKKTPLIDEKRLCPVMSAEKFREVCRDAKYPPAQLKVVLREYVKSLKP